MVVVIFTDTSDHWTKNYIHPVNHCYICYPDNGKWITIDKYRNGFHLQVSDELPEGVYYCKTEIRGPSYFPELPTCVGLVKTLLGINNPFIVTPWQLLNYLRGEHGRQQQSRETEEDSSGRSNGAQAGTRA